MLAADLARCLDPRLWFTDAGISDPDPWQVSAIRSQSKRQLWLCHRQAGKSTTAGLKALERATQSPEQYRQPPWREGGEGGCQGVVVGDERENLHRGRGHDARRVGG